MKTKLWVLLIAFALICSVYLLISRRQGKGLEQTSLTGLYVRHHELALGKLPDDRPVHTTLELHNKRKTPVNVESAVPDCGCTVVQLKERQIPAGGSVSIPVTLNPKGLPSDIHKRVVVRVSTGEVAEQNIVFHLTATIDRMPVVTILPSQIDLEDVVIGADSSKIATVYFNGPRGLFDSIPDSIKVTGLQHEALKVPYKATQPEPSSKAVRIEFSPGADLPRGSFNLDTRIIFVGAETYETRLMIRGTAREELVSNPGQLYLSTGVDSKETGTLLEIGSLRNRAIDPKRISSDLPIAWAVRERSASGDRLKLKVWPAADASVAGVLVGHIKVEMDNQTEPLKIPVTMVQIQSLSSGAVTRN